MFFHNKLVHSEYKLNPWGFSRFWSGLHFKIAAAGFNEKWEPQRLLSPRLVLPKSLINVWFVFCSKRMICQNKRTLEKGIENVSLLNWISNIGSLAGHCRPTCHCGQVAFHIQAFSDLNKPGSAHPPKGNIYQCFVFLFPSRLLKMYPINT